MARPIHTYSQTFLRNPRFIARLVGKSDITKDDLVYDIGAGSGIISAALLKKAGQVVAIEPEPTAAKKWRDRLGRETNARLIQQDFLKLNLPRTESYKVFSNIPFHLSSKILTKLVSAPVQPTSVYLIVQKQFARKLLPSSDFTSALGIYVNAFYRVRIVQDLRRDDFYPQPNVDTVLLELRARKNPYIELEQRQPYLTLIDRCFHSPKEFAKLKQGDIRPSQIHPSDWAKIYKNLSA